MRTPSRVVQLICSVALLAVAHSPASAADRPLPEERCPSFPSLRASYDRKFGALIRTWATRELAAGQTRKVVYLFSGTDAVTALNLFPDANHLILAAYQWPEFTEEAASTKVMSKECDMASYFSRYGYYRTNDLDGLGSVKPRIDALLVDSLRMAGMEILHFGNLTIEEPAEAGAAARKPGAKPDGVRFVVRAPNGAEKTVDYVRIDLSDKGLAAEPRLQRYLAAEMNDTVFIKAASHLPQKPYFSTIAGLSASRPRILLQDETGLDIDALTRAFAVKLYGSFEVPHTLWKDSASAKRLAAYSKSYPDRGELPFRFGYEKKGGFVLLYGTRRPASAPAPAPAPAPAR